MKFNYFYVSMFFLAVLFAGYILMPSGYDMVMIYSKSEKFDDGIALMEKMNFLQKRTPRYFKTKARIFFDAGRYKEAIELLNNAGENLPDDPEIYRLLARMYIDSLRPLNAMKIFEKIVSIIPSDSEALRALVYYYRIFQLTDRAIHNLEQIIRYYPREKNASAELGRLYIASGRIDRGIDILKKALALSPRDADSLNLLVDSLARLGRHNEINSIYAMLATHHPGNSSLMMSRAGGYSNSKEYSKAISLYKKIYSIAPVYEKEEVLLLIAEQYEHQNRVAEAENIYKNLILSASDTANILAKIGSIKTTAGRKEEAVSYFTDALLYDPRNNTALSGLADIYLETKPGQALKYLTRLEKRKPYEPRIYYQLGEVYDNLSRKSRARNFYRKYLNKLDRTGFISYNDVRTRAHAYLRIGMKTRALEILAAAREKYPDNIDLINDYAEILIDLKRYREALRELNRIRG